MVFKKREIILLRTAFIVAAFVLSFIYMYVSWKLFVFSVPWLSRLGLVGLIIIPLVFIAIPVLGLTKVRYHIEKWSDRFAVYVLLATTSQKEYKRVKEAIETAIKVAKKEG